MKIKDIKECETYLESVGFSNYDKYPKLWTLDLNQESTADVILHNSYYGVIELYTKGSLMQSKTFDNLDELRDYLENGY